MIRWFAILFVLGTQGSSQILWAESYPINNVKMVVSLLRNPVVSLERKPVVNLSRNQVVNLSEISTVISIPEGRKLAGDFPNDKLKLVEAWIEIHKDELIADWKLAVSGQPVFKIESLR